MEPGEEDRACVAFEGWGSLAPERDRARAPGELSRAYPEKRPALEEGLGRVSRALRAHYPENLFADLDALAASLAQRSERDLLLAADRVAGLHELYGRGTPIRFRYVHDFIYGFDWARWVVRDPTARAHVGPYDDAFLGHLEQRGRELLELIRENDAKYPALGPQVARSPFPFSREPAAERAIHQSLARKGLLPVAPWSDTPPSWDRPFVALREEEARSLGFWLGPG